VGLWLSDRNSIAVLESTPFSCGALSKED